MGLASLIVGGLTTAANLVQGYNDRKWQERMQEKNMKWQENMQDKANQWQEYMYQKSLHDNSWAGQLKQLQEAGLSPAMLSNSSFQTPQTQSSASAPSPATMPMSHVPTIGDTISQVMESLFKREQVKNLSIQNSILPKLNDLQVKKANAEIDKLVADKNLTDEQANQIKEMLPLLKGKTEVEIDELIELKNKLIEETKNLEEDEKYKVWKNQFLNKFGFNPESPSFNALLQALVSGKGATILDSLFNTIKSTFTDSEAVETTIEKGKKYYDKLKDKEWNYHLKRARNHYKNREERDRKNYGKRRNRFKWSEYDPNATYFHHGR